MVCGLVESEIPCRASRLMQALDFSSGGRWLNESRCAATGQAGLAWRQTVDDWAQGAASAKQQASRPAGLAEGQRRRRSRSH